MRQWLIGLGVASTLAVGTAWSQEDDLDFLFEPDVSSTAPGASENEQADATTQPAPAAAQPNSQSSTNQTAGEAPPASETPEQGEATDTEQARSAPEPGTVSRPSRNRLIEEIVVTARKREESIQDVPIAITAFTADKLDAAGIQSAQQLDKVTPGLVFNSTLGFNLVFLRGIGTNAFLPSADPAVPIYIDDVAVVPTQGSVDTLGNIERVEVLKGPQGTLFGRNSLGGAIRIVTQEPDDQEFFGNVEGQVGNFDRRNVSGFANIPVTDGLAATVSAYSFDADPFYTNLSGNEVFEEASQGGRVKIKWDATNDLSFMLSGSYGTASTPSGLNLEGTEPAAIICAACEADPERDYRIRNNADGGTRTRSHLFAGEVDWSLSWFDTKLILSDQMLDVPLASTDLDGTPTPVVTAFSDEQSVEQRTAELRFSSNDGTPFSDSFTWVAGVYYLEAIGGYDPIRFSVGRNALSDMSGGALDPVIDAAAAVGLSIDQGLGLQSRGLLDTESKSVFGQGSYNLLESLELTLGLRYDVEDRDLLDSELSVFTPQSGETVQVFDFEVPTITTSRYSPRVSLKWQVAPSAQIYTSYAIGYLSPTYNSVNFVVAPDRVEQERSDAYELGFKSNLFSGVVKLEGAVFYTERQDLITGLATVSSGVAVRFFNAGDGEVRGAELGLQAQPLPNLNPGLVILASGSYLDAEYTDYPDGRGFDDETGLGFGPGSATAQPPRDFSGNRIVFTPEFTGTTGLVQTLPLPSDLGSVELGVDAYYNSGFFYTPQNSPLAEQPSYTLLNARASWFYDPWGLQLTVFGQNLTEPEYFSSVFAFDSGTAYQLGAPRTYGLRAKLRF